MPVAQKIAKYNRNRKWKTFLKTLNPTPNALVLDIGFSDREFSETDNFIEKHYQYPHRLIALGLEKPVNLAQRYPQLRYVQYDGSIFPFHDKSFDICWSNAVIEHVGGREEQLQFLKEIKRIARKAFITTPNRYFPFEVHTGTPLLHFMPKPVFERYLTLVGKEWATGSYMNLFSLTEIKTLLRAADITDFSIIKNKILGFSLDFAILMNFDDHT